jgi:hypothetical protein
MARFESALMATPDEIADAIANHRAEWLLPATLPKDRCQFGYQ